MGPFITAGLIGSILTLILQAVKDSVSEKVKHKRELRKLVFTRKLEVVEKAMSWLQESLDTYYILQTSLREYDKDCNPVTVMKLDAACRKCAILSQETPMRLNTLYLYYDFSEIEKRYHGRESLECMNKLITIVVKISYEISNITPSEFSEKLRAALHEQRVEAAHSLADAVDNYMYIISEIMQTLRKEYKGYLG